MKKYKYEQLNYQMIIDNSLTDYLNEKAKDGWLLIKISLGRLVFKKGEPQNIKYQLEYSVPDYEYEDFLKEVGYEQVCQYENIIIYKNNNIHAPDLHSDEIVRISSLMNIIDKHPLITLGLTLILFYPLFWILSLFFTQPLNLGFLFENIEILPLIFILFVFIIDRIITTVISLILKDIIKKVSQNKNVDSSLFNTLCKVRTKLRSAYGILIPILILEGIPLILNNASYLILQIVIINLMMIIIRILTQYRIDKRVITFIGIIFILLFAGFHTQFKKEYAKDETIPKISSYMKEYTEYDEHNGLLLNSIIFSYNPQDQWNAVNNESYITCINDFVAKDVFKDKIIHLENETRASNEAIEKNLNETGTYTSGDIPYYSYKEALSALSQYHHALVDECYYNEHFFIARKDNKILISYMQDEDNYITHVIEHYFHKIKSS